MPISEKIRLQVIAKAGFRCEYCRTYSRLTERIYFRLAKLNFSNILKFAARDITLDFD